MTVLSVLKSVVKATKVVQVQKNHTKLKYMSTSVPVSPQRPVHQQSTISAPATPQQPQQAKTALKEKLTVLRAAYKKLEAESRRIHKIAVMQQEELQEALDARERLEDQVLQQARIIKELTERLAMERELGEDVLRSYAIIPINATSSDNSNNNCNSNNNSAKISLDLQQQTCSYCGSTGNGNNNNNNNSVAMQPHSTNGEEEMALILLSDDERKQVDYILAMTTTDSLSLHTVKSMDDVDDDLSEALPTNNNNNNNNLSSHQQQLQPITTSETLELSHVKDTLVKLQSHNIQLAEDKHQVCHD